jgi:hypothetical protein
VRRAVAVGVLLCVVGAVAVTGAATSLTVSTKRVDAFSAAQTATTISGDTTPPQLQTLEMFDTNTNGRVDQVVATFNEQLQASTSSSGWTLANVPSNGSLSGVNVVLNSTTATVAITEGTGAHNTAVGTFTVALTQATSDIKDAAGNKASFAARAPSDKAKPIPVSLDIANGTGTNNKATQGDTVVVVWSERLLASTICTTVFSDTTPQTHDANLNNGNKITVVQPASASANDQLTADFSCGSFHFGSVDLGSTAYTTATRDFGSNSSNNRSTAKWDPGLATFTLTLGSLAGTDVLGTVSPAPTATYTPDPALTDPAGNPATGTVSKTDTHF